MANSKSKSKSKSKNKGEVASIPRPQQRVEGPINNWRICINCGCYEPFERCTDECCFNEFGKECVFITMLESPQGPMPLAKSHTSKGEGNAKGKPDQLQ